MLLAQHSGYQLLGHPEKGCRSLRDTTEVVEVGRWTEIPGDSPRGDWDENSVELTDLGVTPGNGQGIGGE